MPPVKTDEALAREMLEFCREIRQFISGETYETFLLDGKLRRAVERCLEIVGEAASRVSPAFKAKHPDIPWHKLRGLRNILAHEYGEIQEEVIYQSATLDVPHLIARLELILPGDPAKPEGVSEGRARYRAELRA